MPGPSIDALPDAIHRLTMLAQRGESPSGLQRALAETLVDVLGADQSHVIELDAERKPGKVITVHADAGTTEHAIDPTRTASAFTWVAETAKPAVVADARRPGTLPAELVERFGLASAVLAPLVIADEVAAIAVVGSRAMRSWPTVELHAASCLTEVVATGIALHESRLDASTDHLTGCLNHGAMRARLDEEIDRAGRQGTALAVLLLDLDDFKGVNDRFGHPTGDALLHEVGETLRREFRSFDQVARYGGDEFLVIMPNVRGPRTDLAAARALRLLRGVRFERPDGVLQNITVSVGVAEWYEGETVGDLLRKASAAMRAGKAQGKDRVGRFEREPASETTPETTSSGD